jgi:hypothetical protein
MESHYEIRVTPEGDLRIRCRGLMEKEIVISREGKIEVRACDPAGDPDRSNRMVAQLGLGEGVVWVDVGSVGKIIVPKPPTPPPPPPLLNPLRMQISRVGEITIQQVEERLPFDGFLQINIP